MATRQRTSGTVAGRVAQAMGYPSYEDFEPKFEWREEPTANILRVSLPGFVKEQLRVTYNERPRTVKVRGERPLGTNKFSRFSKDFNVPENCKPGEIRGKFELGTLVLTLPKKTISQVPPEVAPPKVMTQKQPLSEEPKTPEVDQHSVPPKTSSSYNVGKKKNDEKVVTGAKETVDQAKHQEGQEDALPRATSSNANDPTPQNAIWVKPQEAASNVRSDRTAYRADEGLGIIAKVKGDRPTDEMQTTMKPKDQQTPPDRGNKTSQNEDNAQRNGEIKVSRKNNNEARLDNDTRMLSGPDAISGEEIIETENLVGAAKRALKGLTTGLKEDRQLAVNMGVAIVVIVAFGAYLSYKYGSSTRAKN